MVLVVGGFADDESQTSVLLVSAGAKRTVRTR
jgi:hypothetical protein